MSNRPEKYLPKTRIISTSSGLAAVDFDNELLRRMTSSACWDVVKAPGRSYS
jgi:hypothetical protein